MRAIPRTRRATFVVASLVAFLVAPAVAHSSTVSMDAGAHTYSAASGETNRVFIFLGWRYRVVDLGATITVGAGRSSVRSEECRCAPTCGWLWRCRPCRCRTLADELLMP
jgi:hypothetical protein